MALLHARPHERATYLNTLWLFLVGIGGEAAASLIWALNFADAAGTVYAISRFVASIALIRLGGFIAFRLLLPLVGSHPPRIAEDLAIVGVYVVYGFAQLRGAGLDLSSLVTTSAILTAVIAFAMQDTLGNVLAGIAVQLDNSVRIGDWIRVDTVSGRVRDIRWRSTLIETRNWETVVIPNSMLMKARVEILGQREGAPLQWRRILDFMVDPGVPPARVIAIVDDEMRELAIPNVARTPGAELRPQGLRRGQPLLPAALLPHRHPGGRHHRLDGARAPLRLAAARRHPHRRAAAHHARSQRDEAHAETVRRRELTRRLQALATVPPFAALPEETKADIAERLQYAPFARGDIITKQGNKAHWLYILAFGEAEVLYEPPGGAPQRDRHGHAGQFFGEMALITGDARAATVVAKTDVECYRLDRASFQELLSAAPRSARRSSASWAGGAATSTARARPSPSPAPAAEAEVRLATKIRRFFGMGA